MAPEIPGMTWPVILCAVVTCASGTVLSLGSTPTDSETTDTPLLSALRDTHKPASPTSAQTQARHGVHQCMTTKTSNTLSGLQGVATSQNRAATFYIRPWSSFQRLVFRMKVDHALGLTGNFYAEEDINLVSSDLGPEGEWQQVSVEHFERPVRGPNKHSLRVTVGNVYTSLTSDHSWLMYDYVGFSIFAEGGAEFLFYCPPPKLPRVAKASQASGGDGGRARSFGVWMMVGLVALATLLLVALLAVWFSLSSQKKEREKQKRESLEYPIYEEFNEEVLRNIQKKVEALRAGESDTCVVTYDVPKVEKKHVFVETLQKENETTANIYEDPPTLLVARWKETDDVADHIYEEVDDVLEKGKEKCKANGEHSQNVSSTTTHALAKGVKRQQH